MANPFVVVCANGAPYCEYAVKGRWRRRRRLRAGCLLRRVSSGRRSPATSPGPVARRVQEVPPAASRSWRSSVAHKVARRSPTPFGQPAGERPRSCGSSTAGSHGPWATSAERGVLAAGRAAARARRLGPRIGRDEAEPGSVVDDVADDGLGERLRPRRPGTRIASRCSSGGLEMNAASESTAGTPDGRAEDAVVVAAIGAPGGTWRRRPGPPPRRRRTPPRRRPAPRRSAPPAASSPRGDWK